MERPLVKLTNQKIIVLLALAGVAVWYFNDAAKSKKVASKEYDDAQSWGGFGDSPNEFIKNAVKKGWTVA